jgi:hypothetical protein
MDVNEGKKGEELIFVTILFTTKGISSGMP